MWLRALLVWVLLVGLAILNGTGREALLSPRLGATAGHLVSSALLAGLICFTAWPTIPGIAPGTARRAWAVGVLWVGLTVAFEFLAGHYAFGHGECGGVGGQDAGRSPGRPRRGGFVRWPPTSGSIVTQEPAQWLPIDT